MALVIAAAIMIVDARNRLCFFWDLRMRYMEIMRAIMIMVIGSKMMDIIFVVAVVIGFSVDCIRL